MTMTSSNYSIDIANTSSLQQTLLQNLHIQLHNDSRISSNTFQNVQQNLNFLYKINFLQEIWFSFMDIFNVEQTFILHARSHEIFKKLQSNMPQYHSDNNKFIIGKGKQQRRPYLLFRICFQPGDCIFIFISLIINLTP